MTFWLLSLGIHLVLRPEGSSLKEAACAVSSEKRIKPEVMVLLAYNFSTREVEAGGSEVQGQPGIHVLKRNPKVMRKRCV